MQAEGDEDNGETRPLTEAGAILLLTASDLDDRRRRTYARSLFREM